MLKTLKGFVLGFLCCAVIVALAGVAFASTGTKQLNANYEDIQIVIDGQTLIPTDVNGTVVEPFIVDGTTYLPVRAISQALGCIVEWDGNTHTVYVSTIPDDGQAR